MRVVALAMLVACGFHPAVTTGDGGDDMPAGGDADAPRGGPDAAVAITIVQNAVGANAGSHASDAATFDMPQAQGDLIVVVMSWGGGATTVNLADSSGNTYVQLAATTAKGGVTQASFYAENIRAVTANTVTANLSSNENNVTLRMMEYGGIATTNALDVVMIATGMSTTATSPQVTTTHAHELVYAASTNSANAVAQGSGFTPELDYYGDIVEDREVTSIGSYTATVDEGTVQDWIMLIATFRAAS